VNPILQYGNIFYYTEQSFEFIDEYNPSSAPPEFNNTQLGENQLLKTLTYGN